MREAVIVAGVRTPVGKAPKGTLRYYRPDDLAAVVLAELLRRTPVVKPADIEDVILGCAIPEAEQGRNVARIAVLRAGFPDSVAGLTLNRFCASGLEAIAIASQRIQCGGAQILIAGGTESMSLVPPGRRYESYNARLVAEKPWAYFNMGLVGEHVVPVYGISREEQDRIALRSHERASAAIREGRYVDEIVPLEVETQEVDSGGRRRTSRVILDTDEGVRHEPSLTAMAKLRTPFKVNGTVTPGNASQTSDGAAAVLLMDRELAEARGLKPLARLVGYAVAAVPPELTMMAPVEAVPKVLDQVGLKLQDIDLIELNEAFASQMVAVIHELGLDEEKVNVNGGSIAMGHPLGSTGARLTVSLINEMRRRMVRYGMVTMCAAGGHGAAGIFERIVNDSTGR